MARGWLPPFDGISEAQRWARVALCAAIIVVTGVVMYLQWPDSPGNIVDFELTGDDGANAYLNQWSTDDQRQAALVVVLDLPFLVAYGLGGALLLDGVARWSAAWHEGWSRFLAHLAWLPIAAAVFDLVEDFALVLVTADRTEGWPDLARTTAQVKFALIDVYLVALVAAAGTAVVARLQRPRTAVAEA